MSQIWGLFLNMIFDQLDFKEVYKWFTELKMHAKGRSNFKATH